MGRLNLRQKANLHNKHHLVLTDARTGKLKQEAWAYNIILDQGFEQLIENHFGNNHDNSGSYYSIFGKHFSRGWGGATFIGEDDGTILPLAVTNTTLGNELDNKENGYYDHEYDMAGLHASHTRIATWNETECQNSSIKEVGLGVNYAGDDKLCTRALIEDSEGNPIAVEKGEYDILTVYSTVYIELSHNYGTNFKFVEGGPDGVYSTEYNGLLYWVACDAQPSGYVSSYLYNCLFTIYVGTSDDPPASSDPAVKLHSGTVSEQMHLSIEDPDITFDGTNKRITIESQGTGGNARLSASEKNLADGLREVGLVICFLSSSPGGSYSSNNIRCSIFRSVMPITGVWEGHDIIGEELGEGDGIEDTYTLQWGDIVPESETIYVDSVAQVRNTDYTIDNETGQIVFESGSIPAEGEAVTADYSVEYIPKDENHVLDVNFTIQFADGNA